MQMGEATRVKLDYWTARMDRDRREGFDQCAIHIDELAEIVRLAKLGRNLEDGIEVYVRGIRVHVPKGEPGDF
jgi:hypothetical protein